MANTSTGSAYVGQRALDYDDQFPYIAPALKFPFKAFSVCSNTARHVAGCLALYNRAFRQGRQHNVASFKFLADEFPTVGQKRCPGVWPRVAVIQNGCSDEGRILPHPS